MRKIIFAIMALVSTLAVAQSQGDNSVHKLWGYTNDGVEVRQCVNFKADQVDFLFIYKDNEGTYLWETNIWGIINAIRIYYTETVKYYKKEEINFEDKDHMYFPSEKHTIYDFGQFKTIVSMPDPDGTYCDLKYVITKRIVKNYGKRY